MHDSPHHEASRAWEYENGFYLTSRVDRLGKQLDQYELYKRIVQLPGAVVELGVYKGASLARLLTFRAILEAESSRRVFGFDAFGTFPRSEVASADDLGFIDRFEAEAGDGYARTEIATYLDDKGFGNYELVEGDVRNTVPRVLDERPELRIALLHLDMDVYEPTNDAITMLEDRLVPGALIVIDDYGTVGGATQAIDELCARRHLSIEKLPLSHVPSFIVWH
jgi:hypothetical protein